jgi:hypothetical protein
MSPCPPARGTPLNTAELRELIKQELPQLVRTDPEIQDLILRLSRQEFAPKQQTEDRFDRLFAKLERDTEASNRRWEEYNRKEEEHKRKWDEHTRKWEENQTELRRMREEAELRTAEHRREFIAVHEEIMAMARKHDRTMGALGSRWGLSSEKAFRDGLASVLENNFDVRVLNVTEYDDLGTVFGRPEQIELDVIIVNGTLILMELKSSIDKADMYIFGRKARFYEKLHDRKANRLIVISPMIDAKARRVGERLGIEMFGDSVLLESLENT